MPDPEIILEIDLKTGDTTIDLVGFKDGSCKKIDEAAQKLGLKKNVKLKPEAYVPQSAPKRTLTQENK